MRISIIMSAIVAARIIPCTLEFLDRMTAICVEEYAHVGLPTDCAAVLLITASSETKWHGAPRRDLFHGLDQQALFAPITKWTARAGQSVEIPDFLGEAFRQLLDPAYFNRVRVEGGTVVWPDGQDFDPATLYALSASAPV